MTQGFLSYSATDSELAQEVVAAAEQKQHQLWHYKDHSIPAESYLNSIAKAVSASDVVVALVTEAALDSHQIGREIEQAHQLNKRILPVYVGVTSDRVRAVRPGWAVAFGTSSRIKLGDTPEARRNLIRSIVETLDRLQPQERTPELSRWATEATQIRVESLETVLFETPEIREFLEQEHRYFISANKGVGKTLLLKAKRGRLSKRYKAVGASGNSKVQFIPEARPYLDQMSSGWPTMDKRRIDFLSRLENTRRVWSFALRLSVLSHFEDSFELLRNDAVRGKVAERLGSVRPRSPATALFKDLMLDYTSSQLVKLMDDAETTIEYAFRGIHSAVFLFVDRVEQGAPQLTETAWIHVQAGLIEAAWDVMSTNNHVKIFTAIREEAFANYSSDSKINLFGATLNLRYTMPELEEMLDQLTRLYESRPSVKEFLSPERIQNLRCKVLEDPFRYLHRHTVGRPRDLVVICSEISRQRAAGQPRWTHTKLLIAQGLARGS